MKKSYRGNLKPYIAILTHTGDGETFLPVMKILSRKKALCYGKAAMKRDVLARSSAVIAFFTDSCREDIAMQNAVLSAKNLGVTVIPVLKDESVRLPEALQPFFGANNAVYLSRYGTEGLAERLLDTDAVKQTAVTEPQKKRYQLTVALLIAAALAVVALSAVLVFNLPALFASLTSVGTAGETVTPSAETDARVTAAEAAGLTLEDLQKIQTLYLVGGYRLTGNNTPDDVFYTRYDSDSEDPVCIWNDYGYGQAGTVVALDEDIDLSFLSLMTDLRTLVLIEENITALPDLSGLAYLTQVRISYCPVTDISGLYGCQSLKRVTLEYTRVSDLSPLNGCPALYELNFTDSQSGYLKSLNGFCPSKLGSLLLSNCQGLEDVSSLCGCSKLTHVYISAANTLDLSFLQNQSALTVLELNLSGYGARLDFPDLSNVTALTNLYVTAGDITGLEFVSGQKWLTALCISASGTADFPSLANLTNLSSVQLQKGVIDDLSCLEGWNRSKVDKLYICGERVSDFSALSRMGVTQISELGIDLWGYDNGFDYGLLSPYISGLSVNTLSLSHTRNVDFTQMPQVTTLSLSDATNLKDLQGIASLSRLFTLELNYCSSLRSLDGLENSPCVNAVTLRHLPYLSDVDGLYGLTLSTLRWADMPELLPDFSRIQYSNYLILEIDTVPLVENLDFLNAVPDTVHVGELTLNRLDYVTDAEPLLRLKGYSLTYPSQLKEQVEQAREMELLSFSDITEGDPCGSYGDVDIPVESLEALAEMSPLKRSLISCLRMTGGTVLKDGEWSDSQWKNGILVPYVNNAENESYPAGKGTLTDLSLLEGMTGLEELELSFQPLQTVSGIEYFENLRRVTLSDCEELSDITPLFALNALSEIDVGRTGVSSIEGIQNLTHLTGLHLYESDVTDLSPLKYADYTDACAQGGFSLNIDGLSGVTDYSFLASIPCFSHLSISVYDKKQTADIHWTECTEDVEIYELDARNWAFPDDTSLKNFCAAHGELTYICLSWSEQITDLTPLLSLPNLTYVSVSNNMKKAIASLEGKQYSFTLDIVD